MKLLIIGHARHGKDSLCELLSEKGFKYTPTSDIYMDKIIWPAWSDQYENKEEAVVDKVNRRGEMFALISEYCKEDNARFAKDVLEVSDIYCGLRARDEFEASKHLFDLIIWVDATERLPLESPESFELTAEDANYYFDNNFTEREMLSAFDTLMHTLHKMKAKN